MAVNKNTHLCSISFKAKIVIRKVNEKEWEILLNSNQLYQNEKNDKIEIDNDINAGYTFHISLKYQIIKINFNEGH